MSEVKCCCAIASALSSSNMVPTMVMTRSRTAAPPLDVPRSRLRVKDARSAFAAFRETRDRFPHARSGSLCIELRIKIRIAWIVPWSGDTSRRLNSSSAGA